MAQATHATLRIRRGAPDEVSRYQDFQVPFQPGQSLLDALRWIRQHRDATLAVRYACINANACKECLMRLDGKVVYACTARLAETTMVVEPLANKRLLRDLVTDIVPPAEHL